MENFMQLRREFEEAKAIRVTGSADELEQMVGELLANSVEREELGRRAKACFQEHLGAGRRCAEVLISKIMSKESASLKK